MKGISYTIEAAIAGFIIMTGLAFFTTSLGGVDSSLDFIREEGFRCLKSVDDAGTLRSSVQSDDATSINNEVSLCVRSLVNHTVSICRESCSSVSVPEDVTRTSVDYYIAGYTDKDPARVSLILWEA